jgi:flagellar biosynthesis/type III secretory pathway protein FliH
MGEQTFNKKNKTSKILGVLLLVSFIIFVKAASASTESLDANYRAGYQAGVQQGYKIGYADGLKDCSVHGQNTVLTKISDPVIKDEWTENYKTGYKKGYNEGYLTNYSKGRFKCLKK